MSPALTAVQAIPQLVPIELLLQRPPESRGVQQAIDLAAAQQFGKVGDSVPDGRAPKPESVDGRSLVIGV